MVTGMADKKENDKSEINYSEGKAEETMDGQSISSNKVFFSRRRKPSRHVKKRRPRF